MAANKDARTRRKSYAMFFATFEQVLVTIFLWEMLLKWYYGFWIFWKDGWNIADFFVTSALFVGSTLSFTRNHEIFYVLRVLRALRMVRSLAAIQGLSIMVRVIVQSVYDMANIIFLLILITLTAEVSCVQADARVPYLTYHIGWLKDGVIMYWGALYLFTYIIGASFIFANIMVAAVTSNLEEAILEQEEKKHILADVSGLLTELKDESESGPRLDLIHVNDCMKQINMAHKQQPMKYSSLENLNLTTYEEFCLVLEAIQRNLQYYKEIRYELNSIVKELRDTLFNRDQEKQIMHHERRIMDMTEALLTNDMPTFKKKEMLSNLLITEKVRRLTNSPTASSIFSRLSDNPLTSTHVSAPFCATWVCSTHFHTVVQEMISWLATSASTIQFRMAGEFLRLQAQ
ncbi:cation channel sperm-associated protein 4-like [Cetorhinus maximus]